MNVPDIFSSGLVDQYEYELRKVMTFPGLDEARKVREMGIIEDLFPSLWNRILRLRDRFS